MRLAWVAVAISILFSLRADGPELTAIHPIGSERGATNTFTLSGKFEPWPPKFWSSPPGLEFRTDTNKNKVTIEIPSNIKPGARLVRAYNADGVSEPRFFVVGEGREIPEKEPNNRAVEAQDPGPLPVTINARLDKSDDVDDYRVFVPAGGWIEASLEAYTLMAKVDGVLRLLTTNGVTLASNHDFATFDPRLWWQAPADQTVIVQAFGFVYPANAEIRMTGGDSAFYRLRLGTNAPLAWKSSATNFAELPVELAGTIDGVGEEDKFVFSATKDQYYELRVTAATMGSPLDPWLKIRDMAGSVIENIDDSDGSRDPRLEWKAPATTNYVFGVGSTLHRGGPDYRYRASIQMLEPDFRATYSANAVTLKAGETNTIKIDLKRLRGFTNELLAGVHDLPEGVNLALTNSLAKAGEIAFPISVATNAPAFQGPIEIHLVDPARKIDRSVVFELTSRGEDNGVPQGYSTLAINALSNLWLTIKPKVIQVASTNTAPK